LRTFENLGTESLTTSQYSAEYLPEDFNKINDLITIRCAITAAWMQQNQQASSFISSRPL
jgi:hypothetical protein